MPTPSIRSSSENTTDTILTPTSQPQSSDVEGVDERISSWLSNHPDPSEGMAPHSTKSDDPSSLGDSTYEFVDDDIESRDGNATESVASTDYTRPDDVTSLADTENSYDDSESERSHVTSGIPMFAGLDDNEDTPTAGRSATSFLEGIDAPANQPIEFEEPYSVGVEAVYVMHTVKEFSKEEAKAIVQNIGSTPPERLVGTIRQTMTKQGLSSRQPLRILYVGSHSAKQDIIHKIASSVLASVENDTLPDNRPSQLFNVVPVSAFGSHSTPEIELMESSGYQIHVEDCAKAVRIKFEDGQDKPDVLKLTLDYQVSYHSVPEDDGFIIEPSWDLPHVAILYCSDNDTAEMLRTRMVVNSFMNRHGIPKIVISHKQLFETALDWSIGLSQHPLHMCLESRHPTRSENMIHQRLPIALASFMNIDARQMNRNLAYLTKLYEPLQKPVPASPRPQPAGHPVSLVEKQVTDFFSKADRAVVKSRSRPSPWRALMPVGVLIVSVLASVFVNFYDFKSESANLVSINGNRTSTNPSPVPVLATTSNSTPVAASSNTASYSSLTDTKTTTKTITVAHVQTSTTTSLSLLPAKEVSKVAQKIVSPQVSNAEPSCVCTAERIGAQEILIRIPSATKLSWLAKEAMSVNVTRDAQSVGTERVYSSNEGIVLQFHRKEAYGILNISVITTKKPKVNQTFRVDFGSNWSHEFHDAFEKLSQHVYEDVLDVLPGKFSLDATLAKVETWKKEAAKHAQYLVSLSRQRAEEARAKAHEATLESGNKLSVLAQSAASDLAKRGVKTSQELVENLQSRVDMVREPLQDAILHAQVRSRLNWLRLQGKHAEAREYEKRASEAGAVGGKCAGRRCSRRERRERRRAEREGGEKVEGKKVRGGKCGMRCRKVEN